MSIEYTYPEPTPRSAVVRGDTKAYELRKFRDEVQLHIRTNVDFADVPEVCEAMMALAGHEWPVKREPSIEAAKRRAEQEAAERIIARLQKNPASVHDVVRIVREECGVAE